MRPPRRVRAAHKHTDADQRTTHQNPAEHNRQHSPAAATPALSYSVASTLNKGAAGMQLVEAGLQAMSDPISQRPNRESPAKGGCGDAACGSWPASDSASSNISAAVSQTACKRGVSGEAACGSWPARDRPISPANPLYTAFQSCIRIRRDQHCHASRMRPPPRPDRTSRATLHALHIRPRAALHFYL